MSDIGLRISLAPQGRTLDSLKVRPCPTTGITLAILFNWSKIVSKFRVGNINLAGLGVEGTVAGVPGRRYAIKKVHPVLHSHKQIFLRKRAAYAEAIKVQSTNKFCRFFSQTLIPPALDYPKY